MLARHAAGLLRLCALLALILPVVPRHVAAAPPTQAARSPLMVYHELTQRPDGSLPIDAPVLSGDGRRAFWAESPPGSPPVNWVFARDIDGGQPTKIDAYIPLCECTSRIDVSDDAGTVVSTEGVRLRVLSGVTTFGQPREVLRLANNAISAVRISGDGQIVAFIVVRDTTISEPNPRKRGTPIPRGVWVIGAGGGEPIQLAGVREIAAASAVPVAELQADPDFADAEVTTALGVSDDGRRIIFGAHAGKAGEGAFTLGEGSPLTKLVGPVYRVRHVAVSGDGLTLAFVDADPRGAMVTVISGGTPKSLPQVSLGIEERLQLSRDGAMLLGRGRGGRVLVEVATLATRALIPLAPGTLFAPGGSRLFVGEGAESATMNAAGTRLLYVAGREEPNGGNLVVIDLGPSDLGGAPLIRAVHVDPTTIPRDGATSASATAELSWDGTLIGAWLAISRNGELDATFGASPVPMLEGMVGQDPGRVQGVFGANLTSQDKAAVPGPRQLRVMSESQAADGRHHGTVLEADQTLTVGDVGLGGRYQGTLAVADANTMARFADYNWDPRLYSGLRSFRVEITLDPTTNQITAGDLFFQIDQTTNGASIEFDATGASGYYTPLPDGIVGPVEFRGPQTTLYSDNRPGPNPLISPHWLETFSMAGDQAGRLVLCRTADIPLSGEPPLETQRQDCLARALIELQRTP